MNEKSKPQFSIITITFNSEKTVERTLKSVLNQTYKDYEYIIVDGASKDGTMDIVRKYEPLFEGRMKWKSEPDTGIYNAMNKGIMRSTGEIIGIVNSDDWLEPNALENMHSAYMENEKSSDVIYCGGIKYHYEDRFDILNVDLVRFRRNAWRYMMFGIRHPGTFVPKDVYTNVGLFDSKLKLSADQDFILRCYFRGYVFYDTNTIVSNMSDGGFSTCGNKQAIRASRIDMRKSLRNFGVSGINYCLFYYCWLFRGFLRNFIIKLGYSHGH